MCRDLTGRRLADVKEEEKLRRWIERASEREEEKRRRRFVFVFRENFAPADLSDVGEKKDVFSNT